MSRFCINCGTELPENAMFCRNCGTKVNTVKEEVKIEAAQPTVNSEEVKNSAPTLQNQQKQEKIANPKALNMNLITYIIVAAMILITIIIIVAIIVSGKITEKKILDRNESKSQASIDNKDIEDFIEDNDLEEIYKEIDKKENKEKDNAKNSEKETLPQSTVPEDNTTEDTLPEYTEPEAGNGNAPADTSNAGKAQRMTEEEFTLCWFNDPYLDLIPLIGLGTYETIIQSEKYSTAIVSDISRDDVILYCEETGSEGDLDMNGFTVNPKRVADTNEKYAFQVSNKNGVTVYVVWSENVALITVGVE